MRNRALFLQIWLHFERVVAGALLLVLFPLLVLVALLIRIDSPGATIFRQERLGKDARLFTVYKFRTMYTGLEDHVPQDQRRVVEGDNDPRITGVGSWLRKTSLDELPQLWNIVRGDMSLVGPRPILPEQRRAMPPWSEGRFAAKPGVTGLAQVMGRRSLDWLDQLRWDCKFAEDDSVWLRLRILVKTCRILSKNDAVYGQARDNWRSHLPEAAVDGDD